MPTDLFKKSISLLLKRQTSILSAAFVIMSTVLLSQLLGVVRQRLLIHFFGPSNITGSYLISSRYPDLIFQVAIAVAITTAFIPVFSDYLSKNKEEEARTMASILLTLGLVLFTALGIILSIFAPFFLSILNPGAGFSHMQIDLMANMMRIIVVGQILFIVAMFFTALLQSYNHFLIPGLAAATYNLGIIISILVLSPFIGIYSAAVGNIVGALLFVLVQIPLVRKTGFRFHLNFHFSHPGVKTIFHLMWPRAITNIIFYIGTIVIVALISYTANPGRNYFLFDLAQTLAFAPVTLFGQSIAQAAFPVLSRTKDKPEEFKSTFVTSFNEMLYIVLPISALILILRIPIVRLIYGGGNFDWPATVLTGRTLAFFSISIFSEALIALVARAFYALHNTKILLIVGSFTTSFMIALASYLVIMNHLGIEGIAIGYTTASITELVILLFILDRKVGGFAKRLLAVSWAKFFVCTFFTALALYIPIRLLDQLVFDTTRTVNLIMLTGISCLAGLILYLLLTWLLSVKEATTYILMFQKIGNWREILEKSDEVIDPATNRLKS